MIMKVSRRKAWTRAMWYGARRMKKEGDDGESDQVEFIECTWHVTNYTLPFPRPCGTARPSEGCPPPLPHTTAGAHNSFTWSNFLILSPSYTIFCTANIQHFIIHIVFAFKVVSVNVVIFFISIFFVQKFCLFTENIHNVPFPFDMNELTHFSLT